jgi:hypothetical protein
MITNSSMLRPRNRSLANAKPASVENSTTARVTLPDTSTEFARPRRKCASPLASSRCTFSASWPPGVSTGGSPPIASLDRVATTNMK